MTDRIRLSFTDIELSKYNGRIIRQTGNTTFTYSLPVQSNMFYIIRQIVGYSDPSTSAVLSITTDTAGTTIFSNTFSGSVDWKFENPIVLHAEDKNAIVFTASTATTTVMLNVFMSPHIHKEWKT